MTAAAAAMLRGAGARRRWELVAHLARHEVAARHRWTLLGWTWPVARQLAQLAVLVFVFSAVLDLGIEDYALFVFTGLVVWGWFSAGIAAAASSLFTYRHLVFQGRFPTEVLPLLAIAVPFVDLLLALPVLAAMLVIEGELHASAALLPLVLVLQAVLMAGLGWAIAAVSVYLRDVPNLVGVTLLMLFYVTPVYFDVARVPEEYQGILRLNPVALLIEAYRDVLMNGRAPDLDAVGPVAAVAAGLAVAGWLVFSRLRRGFVDEL